MKTEIQQLFTLTGKAFDQQLKKLVDKYGDNQRFKKELATYMKKRLAVTETRLKQAEQSISLREQLNEVSEIISLSYIAKNYFGKTRTWLYQRINGNIVNGKRSKFTSDELERFQEALNDVSKKIGSLSLVG